MIKNENESTLLVSHQQLTDTLGYSVSEQEFNRCRPQIKILSPKLGRFWQSTEGSAGVYIILAGKVRLTDSGNKLIATKEAGASFGECTLFPEASLILYSVRASMNVKLGYLPSELLLALIEQHPEIREHLYQQAQALNSLLLPSHSSSVTSVVKRDQTAGTSRTPKSPKPYFPQPKQQVGHLLQRTLRRYPFFAQQSSSDCGVACLVMVARYWGKHKSVNRLRELANVNRSGSSMWGLSKAAESIGFITNPVQAHLKQLAKQKLPAIVHWEGNHYIVVYEITPKRVVVGDPALGQKTLTQKEFQAGWTGYALLLQPTAMFKHTQEEQNNTGFWQFWELVKPHSWILLEIFLASVFIQILGLITPLFTQILLDRVVVQRSETTLTAIGLGLLIFRLFSIATAGLRVYLLDHTANKIDQALIVGFINHTFRLPLSFFESRYVGDIISRVQENQKIQRFLTGEALSIVLDLLTVFIYLGLMFWYSWKMALLALVIVPPFFLLTLTATPFLRRISREIFAAGVKENRYLIDALHGDRYFL